jgi:asparagine synthase (glutamine-hydrolysing)
LAVNGARGEENLQEEIIERLREAVRLRLVSDVPLGAFLSGGIDSSLVVALMAGIMREPVKTFSISFAQEEYDEARYARMVAGRYETDHHEFRVTPDARAIFPELVWHFDEPFADPAAIPTYYVSKLARQHVTVVLNGDGGDENFAGYPRYASNGALNEPGRV